LSEIGYTYGMKTALIQQKYNLDPEVAKRETTD